MRGQSSEPPRSPRPSSWNVLWLDRRHTRLLDAPHLGEYEAVIFDDQGSSIGGPIAELPPGKALDLPEQAATELSRLLNQRAIELLKMLSHGGIVVVRLRAPSGAYSYRQGMLDVYPRAETIRLSRWWMRAVPRLSVLTQAEQETVKLALGERVSIEEPDHCFEPYLLTARYAAVLDPLVFADQNDRPRVLARNPVGDVVACENDLGGGIVIIVPADGDDATLQTCLDNLLLLRWGHTQTWRVPEEIVLLEQYARITEQLRQERQEVLDGLSAVWERKQRIFSDTDVRRVLSRLDKATGASTSSKETLASLHSLVEIIEDRLGGEAALGAVLNIPKAMINAVKRPANEKQFDVRHSTVGEPTILEADTVRAAITAAATIVQAFVTHLYAATTTKQPPP